ncbi:MAG: alpha-E domain-containing protein [Thalassolituus sp.]|uniref:Protein containing domains DUF403 n=1 Tax=hydrothermal vent metagenome TaxID=652676 RepID=A0A160TF36_9ZZZZ|nr:alpha-E domain-containing protein [Thalassolituus oleivorans]PCI47202.1 MAG: alpha-E domain-containing protein [Oceanospirillales bacterium]AHK16482.1 hypothetical protein R615_12990 [Thalassolituus oleivorans R6-15]APR67913.1 hypothetical protein CN03_13815 [Thalassolituus oleivorans]MBQ0725809.1 alpha-E domain-containing protein [Thalassolituus oleivorans]MBQ0779630.1 alpha-E domain-containing protein [Thalassolituus oleivorans]
MLSRTASELYWLSRYLERAENTVRMLDVSFTVSMMPNKEIAEQELIAPLKISSTYEDFMERYGIVNRDTILQFFALDTLNPSSVISCLNSARDNAKSVRGKISSESWEAINSTWIDLQAMKRSGSVGDASRFFDWVKERSHLYRGAVYGTSLRNDAFRFLRLGTFLERADNTARILDVKYQIENQQDDEGSLEYYRWVAVLRSLGAYEAYQDIFGDRITPEKVAQLLILRAEVPRSIRACLEATNDILQDIEGKSGQAAKRLVAVQYARIQFGDSDYIFRETGLHSYLTDFLARIETIANSIHTAYMEAV